MCFTIYWSATSSDSFDDVGEDFCRLEKGIPAAIDELGHLHYPHKWTMRCRYGCGCYFRHADRDLDLASFCPPEDWSGEEDPVDMEATAKFYDFALSIVNGGFQMDLIDVWEGEEHRPFPTFQVPLSALNRNDFRFLEGCRFDFVP